MEYQPAGRGPPTSSDDAPAFDVVVVGTSAGGLPALTTIFSELTWPLPAAIAVVLHLSPDHSSFLPEVLSRGSGHRIQWATDDSRLEPGTVYVAPPDRHLVIGDRSHLSLTSSPRVHFARPAIDCLFESAAHVFGERAIGVVLTGNGLDGTSGALAVRRSGGVVIAQDEATAEFFSMPREVIVSGAATLVLPLEAIAPMLTDLVRHGRGVLDGVAAAWRGTPAVRREGHPPFGRVVPDPRSPDS